MAHRRDKGEPASVAEPAYGLERHVLGPMETLAQSISTMGPTCSPAMTVPLVFASAGNGTWIAYLLAMGFTLLMALCVGRFAQESASPGSLYVYATQSLPPAAGSVAAWALLIAYIGTGASVIGGFVHYANVVLGEFFRFQLPGSVLIFFATGISAWVAYRDVKVSARLMVWIELGSVLIISAVFALVLWRHGLHIDPAQFTLRGVHFKGVRLGMVLAMFSFVGFESATTLGEEARNPLHVIPRAVVLSALLSGLFFITASYTEVLGFPASAGTLDQCASPLGVLATGAGVPRLGPLIDVGAMVSMFACTLACITAAARVLLLMAVNGLAHRSMARTHDRNCTPHIAVIVSSLVTGLLALGLVIAHVSGETIYDWMGSLATYGFITVYALVAIALPIHLRRERKLTMPIALLSIACVLAMAIVLEGTVYPVPDYPKNWLPYLFLLYLAAGILWNTLRRRNSDPLASEVEPA
ncbi:MAG TPA: APC family permease [Terracidiphilus sp.]|nr:APC family permease [Terracidiphilus sp.]